MKKIFKIVLFVLLLAVLLPILHVIYRPNLIISKAVDKATFTQTSSHFMQWRGAEIHYTDEGTGVPVIMIHGFGGSHRNFEKLKERMKAEYRVIRVDLPGFGLSDLPEPDGANTNYIQQYRDFMSFFLDTLHLDSVYMVGNSMGGMMAWGATADHPGQVKKLVLIASAGYELDKVSAKAARLMKVPGMEFFFNKGLPLSSSLNSAKNVFCDPTKIDTQSVRFNNMLWNRDGNLHAACALASSGQFPDSALICKVTCPTLIIWGDEDKIIPVGHADKFRRDIKRSKVLVLKHCGHVPMIEMPDDTKSAIETFFMN